ncbi:hypothetical protein AMRN_1421 [Malaciobacter marinus]|uniref:Uncharacterized protein n=1 Tax=Malaciobacter marinus TaxID=505249 RepID=A0A347TKM9_9BACT|nr:hypothetical protein [Malaciobacter marinus]AXX87157.1 hypothetical protein AMRN_1421 [Malaciobacter marinus]PHO14820.1 hypothetical protein CPH92_09545 [Malaciobacter marinus]
MSMWEMYTGGDSTPTNWSFGDVTDTANEWMENIGSVWEKYTEIENAVKGNSNKNDNSAKAQEYENINQNAQQDSINPLKNISNTNLVYGGIGLLALFIIFKD